MASSSSAVGTHLASAVRTSIFACVACASFFASARSAASLQAVCSATDSGAITIPAQYFGSFYQGDPASVFIYRWDTNTATNPADGTTVEGMTVFGAIGTATLY